MTRFLVTFEGVLSDGGSSLEVVAFHERLMAELCALRVQEPFIELDLETRRVKYTVVIESTDMSDILGLTSGVFRAAVHAAGASTPDWPVFDLAGCGVSFSSVSTCADQEMPEVDLFVVPGNHDAQRAST